MKKKLRKFFTLTHKANDGFTLVELIVVIAILAILSGVAVPAYSAYIEKSKRAADETLLGAVNNAFAAACAANGTDVYLVNGAYATLTTEGTVDAVYRTAADDEYNKAFDLFFEGNETAAFQVIEGLYFDSTLHVFTEGYVITYNGVSIVLSQEDIQNLKDSAFAEIGSDKLLTMVDKAAQMIIDGMSDPNSTLGQLAESDAAMAHLYKTLGITNGEEVYIMLEEKYPQGEMSDDAYADFLDEKYNQVVANNAVIYAAQNSQAASQGIWDVLKADSVKDAIKANENSDEQLAQSAMALAMYSAYTKTDSMEDVQLGEVYDTLDSAEFKAYLETDQAKSDLEGYLSSMNMVNDSVASDPEAAQGVLINGFKDDQLADLMDGIMAK